MACHRPTFPRLALGLAGFMLLATATGAGLHGQTTSSAPATSAPAALPARIGQIRGGHLGQDAYHGVARTMAAHGMNSIFVSVKAQDPAARRKMLDGWHLAANEAGIHFFPLLSIYRSSDRQHWPLSRHYVDRAGKLYPHTPCPHDRDFWQRKVTDLYVEIAAWAADKPRVPGILLDAEMYGADVSGYPDACFCEASRREVAALLGVDKLDIDDSAELERYRQAAARLAEQSTVETRKQTHAIFPQCILGGYALDRDSPFYRGLARAWGTAEQPVLVFTEQTYETGDSPVIDEWQQRLADWGAHAQIVGGLWINRVPAENIAEQLYHLAKDTRGYWLYEMVALSEKPLVMTLLPEPGAPAYWQQIKQANDELDRKLASGEPYVSPLTLRTFKLPPPGVSVERWRPVTLAAHRRSQPSATEFMLRGSEQMFYFSASAGERVTLDVMVDEINPRKRDVVAVVVVDPAGQVIEQASLDRHGEHSLAFHAESAGTYCVFLKSVRYAYRIERSSHPWLIVNPAGSVHLFLPKRLYVVTRPGANEAIINLSVQSSGEAVVATICDAQGRKLDQITVDTVQSQPLKVPLTQPESQVLQVTFESAPSGKLDDVYLSLGAGVQPWIAGSAEAPFPETR